MAEILCLILLYIIAVYCSYRYGFTRALDEFSDYLIESIKRDNAPK